MHENKRYTSLNELLHFGKSKIGHPAITFSCVLLYVLLPIVYFKIKINSRLSLVADNTFDYSLHHCLKRGVQ